MLSLTNCFSSLTEHGDAAASPVTSLGYTWAMPRLTRSRDRRIFVWTPGGPSATGHRGDEACKEEEKTWAKQLPKDWESKELNW